MSHTRLYGGGVKIGQLDDTHKDANASLFSVRIGHAQCKTLSETLADKLAEAKAEQLGHTLSAVKGEVLVDTLADKEAYSENETFGDTLDDIKVEALVNTPAITYVEGNGKKHSNTLGDTLAQLQLDYGLHIARFLSDFNCGRFPAMVLISAWVSH